MPTSCKGSGTIYFLSMVMIVVSLSTALTERAYRYMNTLNQMEPFMRMNQAEVLTICRIKQNYQNYCEKSELLFYKGCVISIQTDGLRAEIEISYKGYTRSRVLVYDDCEEVVADYY